MSGAHVLTQTFEVGRGVDLKRREIRKVVGRADLAEKHAARLVAELDGIRGAGVHTGVARRRDPHRPMRICRCEAIRGMR